MFLWFIGGSFAIAWVVFHDPAIDYRALFLGALLPDVIDGPFGGPKVMHALPTGVVVLTVVMLATIGRRILRRRLLFVPIGMLLHLVLDGAFRSTTVFWWPLTGSGFAHRRLPSITRGWWDLLFEVIGGLIVLWAYRRFDLGDPSRRRLFLTQGRLDRTLV